MTTNLLPQTTGKDIRSFFSPKGKTSKPGASKLEDKRGKDSRAKPASKDPGKGRGTKSKGLSSSEDEEITRKQKPKESQKKKARKCIDSDSDEDPLPPKIRKATSAKKGESSKSSKSKRLVTVEDSEEEDVVPHKLKKSAKQTETKTSKEVVHVKESPVKPKETPQKLTSALDFFGSTPAERESRKVFATKRKQRSDEPEENGRTLAYEERESLHGKEKRRKENENLNGRATEQPSKKRKEDSSSIPQLNIKRASPEKKTSESVSKTTPASRLAAKAAAAAASKTTAVIPDTPVRDTKQSPKKTVSPKKSGDKGVVKESPSEKTPKTPKSDEPDEIPPSLEKKKSSYRSFMARDGPRALGSKSLPEGEENCLEGLTFCYYWCAGKY